MEKISAVYQIKNKLTGERYVGSSVDVYERWRAHKKPSTWKRDYKKLYQDMQEYGIDNFMFAILAPVEPEHLRQVEQEFIELLQPAYNNYRANGRSIERYKSRKKAYQSQLCSYNGETLTLGALRERFKRADMPHAQLEAKKYLLPSID